MRLRRLFYTAIGLVFALAAPTTLHAQTKKTLVRLNSWF